MEIIKRKAMNYQEIKKTEEYKGDRNCCTVVSCSIVFDTPFIEMQSFFFNHMGRKKNKGVYFETSRVKKVAENFGYKITTLRDISSTNKSQYKGMTANNCSKYLDNGTYILGCKGHVLAFKNGIVEDWTKGRYHRINRIWKVEKAEKIVKSSQNFFNEFLQTL